MDLIFDTQVLRHRGKDELPEPVLGHRIVSTAEQSRLARGVCWDHLLRVACMSAFLVLGLGLP